MIARIHSFMANSSVNGPGQRSVLWFQGCNLACPGCWNPLTHPKATGRIHRIWELTNMITCAVGNNPQIEGITLSGGEPMQQAPAVIELLLAIRKHYPKLSIGMFTGYSEQELERGSYECAKDAAYEHEAACPSCRADLWEAIKSRLDFAAMGRFNGLRPETDPLVTSTNQKLALYSKRYTAADFPPQSIEVQIDGAGLTQITGFPVRGF